MVNAGIGADPTLRKACSSSTSFNQATTLRLWLDLLGDDVGIEQKAQIEFAGIILGTLDHQA